MAISSNDSRLLVELHRAARIQHDVRAGEALAVLARGGVKIFPVWEAWKTGLPFPQRSYVPRARRAFMHEDATQRSARLYEGHSQQGMHSSPGVVFFAEGFWHVRCRADGCGIVFLSAAKQKKFCSRKCRESYGRASRAANRARLERATVECSKSGCSQRIFQLRTDHRYCSSRCRDAARVRSKVAHEPRECNACNESFTPKNSRGKFCSDRCRVRAWSQKSS